MKKGLFVCGCFLVLFFPLRSGFAQNQADAGLDALAEYRNRNYQTAVTICKNELAQDPGNLESHVVLCWSLISLGRYEEALNYARQGRLLSRYDPRIIEILGEISYYQGRNNDGLEYFRSMSTLPPSAAVSTRSTILSGRYTSGWAVFAMRILPSPRLCTTCRETPPGGPGWPMPGKMRGNCRRRSAPMNGPWR